MPIDLGPATQRMADLLGRVTDDQLKLPTPCPEYTLGHLIDHISGLSVAFTLAARKDVPPGSSQAPTTDPARLGEDWRSRVPAELEALAEAWRVPGAWTGMTEAGGVELPGEVAGLVALNEVVVHAWDVARSIGEPYDVDEASVEACRVFVAPVAGEDDAPEGLFAKPVPVPADASALDQLIGLTGRDPHWKP